MKGFNILFLVVLFQACLVLGPPTHYSYKMLNNNDRGNDSVDLEVKSLGITFTPEQSHIRTFQILYLINNNNNIKRIYNYDFKLISKLMDYDTIKIRNLDSIEVKKEIKLYNTKKLFEIFPKDTLKLMIEYFTSSEKDPKIERYFKENIMNDTVVSKIDIENLEYQFKFIGINK